MKELEGAVGVVEAWDCLHSAPMGIVVVDYDGQIVFVTEHALAMFGYTAEEVQGQPVELLIPEALRAKHVKQRTDYMGHPTARAMGAGRDLFGCRKDGRQIPVEVGLNPVRHHEREFILAAIVDISERKRIEERRTKLVDTLNHDLKNPLMAIQLLLGSLAKGRGGELNDRGRAAVDTCTQEVKEMVSLIQDFLDTERMEKGVAAISLSAVDLRQFLATLFESLQALAAKEGCRLVYVEPLAEGKVLADPHRVGQVVKNLVSNAAKFSPSGRAVEVALTPAPDGMRCSVEDHGRGISDEDRPNVFKRFSQLKEEDSGRGSGLGLSICKEIVEAMGGQISFESEVGTGTTFHIALPYVPGQGDPTENDAKR